MFHQTSTNRLKPNEPGGKIPHILELPLPYIPLHNDSNRGLKNVLETLPDPVGVGHR